MFPTAETLIAVFLLAAGLVRRHLSQGVASAQGGAALIQQLQRLQKLDLPSQQLHASQPPEPAMLQTAGGKAATASDVPVAAAVLLEYCLSDIDMPAGQQSDTGGSTHRALVKSSTASQQSRVQSAPSDRSREAAGKQQTNGKKEDVIRKDAAQLMSQAQAAVAELNGLPLLPLMDMSLGVVRATSGTGSASGHSSHPGSQPVYILPATEEEERLLAGVRGLVISRASLTPTLATKLLQLGTLGLINVLPLTPASLNDHVLPRLLPTAWRGAACVPWHAEAPPAPPTTADPAPGGASTAAAAASSGNPTPTATTAPGTAAVSPALHQAQPLDVSWLRALWVWLAGFGEGVLAIRDWPLLPIKGGKLCALRPHSQVLREGDWPEQVTQALAKLGCMLLDVEGHGPGHAAAGEQPLSSVPAAAGSSGPGSAGNNASGVLPEGLLHSAALAAVVQAPTLQGVLRAIQGHGATGATTGGQAALSQSQAAQALTAAERRQLRAYLLQQRWFAAAPAGAQLGAAADGAHNGGQADGTQPLLTDDLLTTLRALPIYEVHPGHVPGAAQEAPAPGATAAGALASVTPPATPDQAAGSMQLQAGGSLSLVGNGEMEKSGEGVELFVALSQPQPLYLAPPGVDARLLGPAFLHAASASEEVGAGRWTRCWQAI